MPWPRSHAVGEAHAGGQVLEAGVVELVAAQRLRSAAAPRGQGWSAVGCQAHVAAADRPLVHAPTSPGIAPTMRRCGPASAGCAPGTSGRRIRHRSAGRRRWLRAMSARRLALASSSAMKTSGKPPPMNRPSSAGRRASCRVSNGTSSAPAASQRLQVVGVVEAEGLVARDADAHRAAARAAAAGGAPRGHAGSGVGSARELEHALQIHLLGDRRAQPAHALRRVVDFGAGHQAEMALDQRQARVPAPPRRAPARRCSARSRRAAWLRGGCRRAG